MKQRFFHVKFTSNGAAIMEFPDMQGKTGIARECRDGWRLYVKVDGQKTFGYWWRGFWVIEGDRDNIDCTA